LSGTAKLNWLYTVYLLLIISGAAHCGTAEVYSISLGVEYASGDYGGEGSIEDIYVPLSVRYASERFAARVTVPYTSSQSPAIQFTGPNDIITSESSKQSESGLGDISLAVSYLGLAESRDWALDFTAKIKWGTASAGDGLGTGENDYSLQFDAYVWQRRLLWMATIGYRWRGDRGTYEFDDTWFLSVGAAWNLRSSIRLGLLLAHRPSSTTFSDDVTDLTLFLGKRWNRHWSAQVYTLFGVTDGSPDRGFGVSLTRHF